jgi:amino-acid N-acetyltransferase
MELRKASMSDIPAIQALVNAYAREEQMLAVSLVDLYDNLRDFFVCEVDGAFAGTMALHFVWDGLAEVRSLAVARAHQRRGVARRLVEAGVEEARVYDCRRVFALTYVPDFFRKLGFREIDKHELPHKVWADCVKCPKFPDCGEIPLALDLAGRAGEETA